MNLIELNRALGQLRLGGIAAVLETRLRQAQAEAMPPIDFLSCLVSDELTRRGERLLERRKKQAGFRDPQKTLDKFDFNFNRKMNRGRAPRETLLAPAASSTPGWGVRSPGSAAPGAAHAITPRTQTEPERWRSVLQRSRWRPSVPYDWSRRFAKFGMVASAAGEDIWPRSIALLRFPTCSIRRESAVLPTTGWLGSCPESSREVPAPRSVFPDASVISASQTMAPTGPPSRQQSPQQSVGALEAQTSRRVLLENRELVTKRNDLHLQGGTGSKTGRYQSEKGDEKRAHRDHTRISRILGTPAFSARTEFSVTTGRR
jgi:hypothetical protein